MNVLAKSVEIDKALVSLANCLTDPHYFNLQRARYAWLLKHMVDQIPMGSRIADVGAAPGHMSFLLSKLGYKVVAFDFDPDADHWESKENSSFSKFLKECDIQAVKWDIEVRDPTTNFELGEQTESFDAVIFTEVLEHIYHYPFASVRKIAKLLKPGGKLYLTTPNRGYITFRLKALCGLPIDTRLQLLRDEFPPHMRHVWQYSDAELSELLSECGFEVILNETVSFHLWTTTISDREILPYWKPSSIKQLAKLPLALLLTAFPFMGSNLCFIAKKLTN